MDTSIHTSEVDPKYLMGQLKTARKEINNLRQQVKNLRHILDKDVDGIKQALGSFDNERKNGSTPICVSANGENGVQAGTSMQIDNCLKLKPIGVIKTGFPSKRGTPRQPAVCKTAAGKVTLFNSIFTNPEHALIGLHDFSHMWILFHFHRNDSTHVRAKVSPPRLNGERTGVFSTRSPHRPCPIGLSLVRIIKIDGRVIYFEGVDMVDQTPVLDIKPYIPQYDNPMHIEKMITNRLLRDDDDDDAVEPQNFTETRTSNDYSTTTVNSTDFNDTLTNNSSAFASDRNFNGDENREESPWNCCRLGSSSNGDADDTCARIASSNVARDEEIAMRLQAEEFEATPNFDDYASRNYLSSTNVIADSQIDREIFTIDDRTNVERDFGSLTVESRSENFVSTISESSNVEFAVQRHNDDTSSTEMPRNSMLLDGADGPSTVCGTDMDLIQRRRLNSRNDNSPIRMGVREAPDGEEGLESQTVTPSQTVANMQNIVNPNVATSNEAANQNVNSDNRPTASHYRGEIGSFEVRVPEWISRSRNTTLSVVFNERALNQLTEILHEKADEQKISIECVLSQDPRSVYLRQRWGNQFYTFLINDLHISCRFDDNRGIVTVFQVRHAGRTCDCGEPEWQCLGHSPLS